MTSPCVLPYLLFALVLLVESLACSRRKSTSNSKCNQERSTCRVSLTPHPSFRTGSVQTGISLYFSFLSLQGVLCSLRCTLCCRLYCSTLRMSFPLLQYSSASSKRRVCVFDRCRFSLAHREGNKNRKCTMDMVHRGCTRCAK